MRRIWILVGALALVTAACTDTSAGDVDSGVAAPVEQAASGGGVTGEGIEVHGDWSITVVNPDGSVASETEFSNALTASGRFLLKDLLAGNVAVSTWAVRVVTVFSPGTLCPSTPVCYIATPVAPSGLANIGSNDLQVSGAINLVLSGSLTAIADGQITQVQTTAFAPFPNGFSSMAGLSVDVLAGQQVLVTVTISFS